MSALHVADRPQPFILKGDLDFYSVPALSKSLQSAIGWDEVTVDLSGVSFLDAGVLGFFVGLHKTMRLAHDLSTIRFTGVAPRFVRLFHITGLDAVFSIMPADELG
jgi:anti-anti-sigma factor